MSELAYDIASRFIGMKEVPGSTANPAILAMLKLDGDWPQDDSVPWCSAFVNYIHWLLGLERTKSLRARSWLKAGQGIDMREAKLGDVAVLSRGSGEQPGPDVVDAPGHVGFFGGWLWEYGACLYGGWIWEDDKCLPDKVRLLGGNQADSVSVAHYPVERVLGIRRF